MNEPELKMTLLCRDCGNQYGRWRPQCPACGTPTPPPPRAEVKRQERAARPPRPRRADECIDCRRRRAKVRCPHCTELIHPRCLKLHAPHCARFQVEREAAITEVTR